jgi:hypothetical protein
MGWGGVAWPATELNPRGIYSNGRRLSDSAGER